MDFDIIVIGAGSGGLNIAAFMNKAGFNTLLIDKADKNIGGDCLNFGCVPSKALIHVAKLAHNAKDAGRFGLKTAGKIDLKKVMRYVKDKQGIIREHENAAWFRKQGMTIELGKAHFAGKNAVSINGKTYTGKKIILATGSRPRKLAIPGIEKIDYHTNETIFDLKKLPNKLLIIGGGPIGIELGQAFQRLGSRVTVIQRGPTFLPKENPQMAEVLLHQLRKEGMMFHFNSSPKEFKDKKTIIIEDKNNKKTRIKFDEVLVSIGRVLNTEGLALDQAGIDQDEKGKIKVDDYLRTTNKKVLLCGDIAGHYQFTHAAELHASVIITNFFSPFKKKVSYDNFSWVTFTQPEIATFGLNQAQLLERNIPFEQLEYGFEEDDRSITDDYREGKLMIYVDKKGKLLGGSMAAMHAGELFQELVLANSAGLPIKSIFNKIYAYPTASRVNKRVISLSFSKKLSKTAKRMLKFLYR